MASAVDDTMRRTSRVSSPESIEDDLAALWRELAQGDAPIARAVMSNLVVFRDRIDVDAAELEVMTAGLPIDEVVARHPSRVLVVEHALGDQAASAPFAAAIGIVAFGPPNARYGVEQIVLRSACAEASLPSIVRRFIRGDLPTSVWWTEDLARRPPLEAFVTIGRQLVYDSRDWHDVRAALRALAPLVAEHRIDLADVNWRRLTPLRRAIEHATRTSAATVPTTGAQVRIEHRAEDEALAWLLAGWLLAARPANAATPAPEVVPSSSGDAVLAVSMRDGSEDVLVTLTTRAVVIAAHGATAPLSVGVPIETEVDAIAAELRTLSQDTTLRAALRALVELFDASAPR
jgi:glucose-6-phosphate dehydrogenase assembly protein OpcA